MTQMKRIVFFVFVRRGCGLNSRVDQMQGNGEAVEYSPFLNTFHDPRPTCAGWKRERHQG